MSIPKARTRYVPVRRCHRLPTAPNRTQGVMSAEPPNGSRGVRIPGGPLAIILVLAALFVGCGDDDDSGLIQKVEQGSIAERLSNICKRSDPDSYVTGLAPKEGTPGSGTVSWMVVCANGHVYEVQAAE